LEHTPHSHNAVVPTPRPHLRGKSDPLSTSEPKLKSALVQRTSELSVTATGGAIGYSTGSPLRLIEDLQVLKPNVILSVPRILNRIYQAIAANLKAPGLKGALLRRGVAVKLERFKQTGDHTHPFWDKLVFNKVRAIIGGKVELLGCGSAPLNPEITDFLSVTLVCDIIQGYGMTENCGTCTRVFPGDPTAAGTVGLPQPVNEIKLVDVPSMGYSVLDQPHPRGEICMRGDNCFSEYYKSEPPPFTLFAPSVESLDL